VDKPWGTFDRYTLNEATTVKIIRVASGSRLSLQCHKKREELWVALDEGLKVEINGDSRTLQANEEITVPRGAMHRMSNVSGQNVRILEISFGVFDEEDIERFEDDHNRV
jgi:mannose-1-phosphate guanylyltransferase/mannose-6-phosphate isomerase